MNRVLYRIALVPMGNHVFALAQFQNIGYILIYFSLLAARYRQGKVTREMISIPKGRFVLTGGCEALAQLLMMAGAAKLPGPLLPLLMQTGLLWNVLFSALLLGKCPTALQLLGVFLVISGVCLASLPGPSGAAAAGAGAAAGGAAALLQAGELKYVALCVASFAFPAFSVIIKEQIFRDAKRQLGGCDLDVLVVNALGSTAQAAFVLLLLPFITAARGLPLGALPSVLSDGAAALAAEPAFPLAYVAFNIAFNISALALVRSTSALAASLTLSAVVPLSVAAFTLPLPLLPRAALAPPFWAGCVLLMAGLWAYNWRRGGDGRAAGGGKAGGG